ncbi:hypothetical protein JX266_014039 [Neoarthrinium moseri]|nr:hypothetical protein JX266_014039 [Neoarthrinium moseri]
MESLHILQATAKKAGVSMVEVRDTTDPALITQMLLPLLEAVGSHFNTPLLRKHVRDDVNIDNAEFPWRRLPFWLILRVAVQRQLSLELGNTLGRLAYKSLMCILLAKLLKQCTRSLEPELVALLRARLCCRMAKIETSCDGMESNDDSKVCQSLIREIGHMIKMQIEAANSQLDNVWRNSKRNTVRQVLKLPSRVEDESLQLSLLNSGGYLDRVLCSPPLRQELFISSNLPPSLDKSIVQTQAFTSEVIGIQVAEMEIITQCEKPDSISPSESSCRKIAGLINDYISRVGDLYDSSPEHLSTKMLHVFLLWVRLDKAVIVSCPIIGDHRPPFEPQLLDVLQLPTLADISRLREVQSYLRGRQATATYDSVLGVLGKDCFAARFVANSPDMLSLGRKIQAASDKARDAKKNEWIKACTTYDEHSKGFSEGVCRCSRDPRTGEKNVRGCTKCWHGRSKRRIKIEVHEDFFQERIPHVRS